MCGILQNSSTIRPYLYPSKFANELLTQDTNEASPQTQNPCRAWKDSACVHEMTMVNQRHEWDPRKAITRP